MLMFKNLNKADALLSQMFLHRAYYLDRLFNFITKHNLSGFTYDHFHPLYFFDGFCRMTSWMWWAALTSQKRR